MNMTGFVLTSDHVHNVARLLHYSFPFGYYYFWIMEAELCFVGACHATINRLFTVIFVDHVIMLSALRINGHRILQCTLYSRQYRGPIENRSRIDFEFNAI